MFLKHLNGQCKLILVLPLIIFAGCGGRESHPVSTYMPGDENLSCTELKAEIMQLRTDMMRLLPKTDKAFTNSVLSTSLITIFFMDMKQGEKTEFDAMRRRHNRLLLFAEKGE